MHVHNWLAGVAAATLAGAAPAAAQAPRSLFEASPAPAGGSPVTMGFQSVAPAKPAAATGPSQPSVSPAAPAPAKPVAAKAADPKPAESKLVKSADAKPAPLKPTDAKASIAPAIDPSKPEKASASERREQPRSRLAARSEPPALTLPPSAAAPAPILNPGAAGAAAPPAEAAKPLSRSEQRRAAREAKRQAATDLAAPAVQQTAPSFTANPFQSLFGMPAQPSGSALSNAAPAGRSQIDALVAHHARLNGVPESLVHRVIVRESKYNPRAVGRGGAMGLMQIKTATARGVGYTGGPAGLLDAETNLTYAVKYLAGAWRVSGGSHDRAVMHYARGYYYEAKRLGHAGPRGRRGQPEPTTTASVPAPTPNLFSLFSQPAR